MSNVTRLHPVIRWGSGVERRLNSERCNLSGDVTHFCEYGRYFLIGYYLSQIENLLLLAERAKENIRFEIVLTG